MKKASKTLLIIGAILSIVMAIVWFVLGLIWLLAAGTFAAIKEGTISVTVDQAREILKAGGIDAVISSYTAGGIIFMILFVIAIASTIVAFIAKNRENKGLFIANIVLGLGCGAELNAIGGVLGLIAAINKKE